MNAAGHSTNKMEGHWRQAKAKRAKTKYISFCREPRSSYAEPERDVIYLSSRNMKVTHDVIHPRTVLRRSKALYLSHNSEPKSFRECISFFLFRFTALMKYLFNFVRKSHDY